MSPLSVLGLGMDLVDQDRIAKSYEQFGEKFALKICTQQEWDYCRGQSNPIPSLSARFAAKEAVSKALGVGIGSDCELHDIEVVLDERRAPFLILTGAALHTSQAKGISSWMITLTHSRHAASAVVIALG